MLEKIIEIEIGIAIEIDNNCSISMSDPDFDSDFDPEKDISEAIKAKVNGIGVHRLICTNELRVMPEPTES